MSLPPRLAMPGDLITIYCPLKDEWEEAIVHDYVSGTENVIPQQLIVHCSRWDWETGQKQISVTVNVKDYDTKWKFVHNHKTVFRALYSPRSNGLRFK